MLYPRELASHNNPKFDLQLKPKTGAVNLNSISWPQVQEANKRLKRFTQELVSKTRLANAKADAMKEKQLENKKKTKRTRRRKRKKTK